jgi:hypothetical protein
LGHDFTEDNCGVLDRNADMRGVRPTNEYRGAKDSRPASTQRPVEHDGESFVGDDVAKEKGHQHPMFAALEQAQHPRRVLALVGLARLSKHL